jgi:hypothetical protein
MMNLHEGKKKGSGRCCSAALSGLCAIIPVNGACVAPNGATNSAQTIDGTVLRAATTMDFQRQSQMRTGIGRNCPAV